MRANLPFFVLLLMIAPSIAAAQEAPLEPQQLATQQREHAAPALLDVRTPLEYREGHIAGAMNMAVDQLAARYGALGFQRDQDIVVYCKSGRRAAKAQQMLQSLGYRHVRQLDGSIQAWQVEHLPLVREDASVH